MNILDMNTRKPIVPITLVKEMPFNPVIQTTIHTSVQQHLQGTLMGFATDFLLVLKEAGCDPSEAFAVTSLMETMVCEQSTIVDVGPEECDLIWR